MQIRGRALVLTGAADAAQAAVDRGLRDIEQTRDLADRALDAEDPLRVEHAQQAQALIDRNV